MARGWESKAVESQQDERAQARQSPPKQVSSPAERAAEQRRRTLALARARMLGDLAACTSAAHRTMLERALHALDEELQQLASLAQQR